MSDVNNSNGDASSSAKNIPTRVDAIHFEGLDRTKHDILRKLVKPILQTSNIAEVLQATQLVQQRFHELGLFRNVQVSIDEAKKPLSDAADLGGVASDVSNLAISFDVEETRRYAGGIFTSASNVNDASLILELRSPNLLGRGEEIQGRFEHSWKYFSSWSAMLSKPIINSSLWPNLNSRFDLSVAQAAKDLPWSGFKQLDRSVFADLSIQQNEKNHHLLRWETSWRYLSGHDLNSPSSHKIREQMGHSLKSSFSHVFTHDRRDHAVLPTSGFMFRLLNEYAGFHKDGGVSFLKQEIEAQHNISIFNRIILQASAKLGILKPYDNVLVADKFFLGGPLNLRAFCMNGVGPQDNKMALGANNYWIGGLHCYLPLPFRNAFNECLRLHGFVNAGNIANSISRELFQKDVRVSAGAGLVMSFGSKVRLEINYCVPLRQQSDDKAQNGLQFGVGINYT